MSEFETSINQIAANILNQTSSAAITNEIQSNVLSNHSDFVNFLYQINDANLVKQILGHAAEIDSIVTSIVSSVEFPKLMFKYSNHFEITKVLITYLNNFLRNESKIPNLNKISPFLCTCLVQDDIELTEKLTNFIIHVFTKSNHQIEEVCYQLMKQLYELSQSYRQDSVVYIRFMTIFSKVSGLNAPSYSIVLQSQALQALTTLCMTNDILVQINVLNLLIDITNTVDGSNYLLSNGIIAWLIHCTTSLSPDSFDPSIDPIIAEEALRVLSEIFRISSLHQTDLILQIGSSLVQKYLQAINYALESTNESQILTGLNSISKFCCSSTQQLQTILEDPVLLAAWLTLLNSSGKPEVKAAVLTSISYVMNDVSFQSSSPSDNVTQLKQRLFQTLGKVRKVNQNVTSTSLMSPIVLYLLKLAQQPMNEFRFAAIELIKSIIYQPDSHWGLPILFPSFIPLEANEFCIYLRNRNSEFSKIGKDKKFELIEALHKHPLRTMLSQEFNNHLEVMIQQGPYYMPRKLEEMQTME